MLRLLSPEERAKLALEKETITIAMQLGGVSTDEVLAWTPAPDQPRRSFLEGLPGAYVREDAMLITDFSQIPGFNAVKDLPYAAKEFVDSRDETSRLVIIMANRFPLEEQTGADLITTTNHYDPL